MTQEQKPMTAEQFGVQATIDALCAQRNKALDENAQLTAQARVAMAERDGFIQAGKTLIAALDCNEEALGKVAELRKLFEEIKAPAQQ